MVSITPTLTDTSVGAIERFNPIERECYVQDEFNLKMVPTRDGYRYSIQNCLYSSLLDQIINNCSCLPHFYFNYKYDTTLKMPPCQGKQLACSNGWLTILGDPNLQSAQDDKNQSHICLLPCTFQSEYLTVTTSSYPDKSLFPYRKDVCLALQKLARLCGIPYRNSVLETSMKSSGLTCQTILKANNTDGICDENDLISNDSLIRSNLLLIDFLTKYAKNNFAIVTVFIKDPFFTKIVREEAISFIEFLGNIGGLLGLFLGVSIISCFEIVCHFIHFAVEKTYKIVCLGSSFRRRRSEMK